jgi:hypothetical protein
LWPVKEILYRTRSRCKPTCQPTCQSSRECSRSKTGDPFPSALHRGALVSRDWVDTCSPAALSRHARRSTLPPECHLLPPYARHPRATMSCPVERALWQPIERIKSTRLQGPWGVWLMLVRPTDLHGRGRGQCGGAERTRNFGELADRLDRDPRGDWSSSTSLRLNHGASTS